MGGGRRQCCLGISAPGSTYRACALPETSTRCSAHLSPQTYNCEVPYITSVKWMLLHFVIIMCIFMECCQVSIYVLSALLGPSEK